MQAADEWPRRHSSGGGSLKGFDGLAAGGADGNDDASHRKRMSSASDMSKQQVEELVTKLTIDEMKTKWFDEIYSKVKTELVDNTSSSNSFSVNTPSSDGTLSPGSQTKPYQATVEDDPDDSSHHQARNNNSNDSGRSSPSSSVASDSASSKVSNMSAKRTAPSGVLRTPGSRPSSPRPRQTVRFSDRVPVVLQGRPAGASAQDSGSPRLESPEARGVERPHMSAVDLKWGVLFDDEGEPTARLGQFLRGIANYLIAEYTPTNSLVITPDKLFAFYSTYKVESDTIPYDDLFNVRPRDHAALEWLYQDLGCSYHLVQDRPDSTPRVPALTPSGFQRWMVQQVQMFPDHEARRLHAVVERLPISADGPLLDGKPERLPRQLSRRLLPAQGDDQVQARVLKSVLDFIGEKDARVGAAETSVVASPTHYHRSFREDRSGRYRPEDYGSSRHRHKPSSSSHSKTSSSSRRDRPGASRAHSDGNIVRPGKSRSPTSGRTYRTSTNSLTGTDDYSLSGAPGGSSPTTYSHHGRFGGERRAREQEYRFYQSRGGVAPGEATPRTFVGSSSSGGGKRQGLVVDTGAAAREEAYEDYVPRSSRGPRTSGLGVDEMGAYRGGG